MKKLVLSLMISLLPSIGLATCEDGHSIAESAVRGKIASKLDPKLRALMNCKYNAEEDFEVLKNGDELYTVVSVCGSSVDKTSKIYQVVLHEVEDAVCVAKSVKLVGAQG